MALFNFVGPSYEAANPLQDSQRLVNWYTELDQTDGAKSPIALLGCPGKLAINSSYSGEWRGYWVMPGNTTAIGVVGNQAVLITASAGTFTFQNIGTLLTSNGQVGIRDNGIGHVVVIVDGANGYTYLTRTGAFSRITDAAFLGADKIIFIDGWLGFNQPGTQNFYVAPLYWDGIKAIDGTFFALKDTNTDLLVTHIENNREWWLIGERTTEIWDDAGGTNFPFQRQTGTILQIGCVAKHTVIRTGQGLLWLAQSERGQNFVVMTRGYEWGVISTPAIDQAINSYAVVSDAIAYFYTEAGHDFYVLTFPTADVTWCLDLSTKQWHQRLSMNPGDKTLHRDRSNCCMDLANTRIVGDYANGKIYQLSRKFYSEDGAPLPAIRRAPHFWDGSDRDRVRHNRLQVEFVPGVGLSGQLAPQAMLRWSDDGGFNWSNEYWTDIGAIGQTTRRAIWRRLGSARDRMYEVTITDPVQRDVVGASLDVEGNHA